MNTKIFFFLKLPPGELLWLSACGFMVALWGGEVWSVLTEPEKYAFLWGGEGPVAGVWHYASEDRYLFHLVCLIVWFLAGMALCLCKRACRRKLLLLHCCLSMLWLAAVYIPVD